MTNIKRINWIDWAKVIGITAVVLGHTYFDGSEDIFRSFIYSFHMPLFFLISGYLYKQAASFGIHLKKDLKTLILPYILLNLVVFGIFLLPAMIIKGLDMSELKEIGFSFLIAEGDAPARACWFLLALFFTRFSVYFILKLKFTLQILVTIILALVAYCLANEVYYHVPLGVDRGVTAIPFFLVGFYMKQTELISRLTNKVAIAALFVGLLIAQLVLIQVQGTSDLSVRSWGIYPALYYPVSLIGCAMVLMLCKLLDNIESKLVMQISAGTLVILAFNDYFIKIMYRIAYAVIPNYQMSFEKNIVISILVVISLYIPIVLIQKYCPILIGGRKLK